MFQFFSSAVMLLVVSLLIAGGVRTIIHVSREEEKDVMELVLTGLVLICLALYAGVLVAMMVGSVT